jgi:hypothetical protein
VVHIEVTSLCLRMMMVSRVLNKLSLRKQKSHQLFQQREFNVKTSEFGIKLLTR